MNVARKALALTSIALALLGCKPDAAVQKSQVVGRGSQPVASPPAGEPQSMTADMPGSASATPTGPTGSSTGTVAFSGKAPAPIRIDRSMDPACTLGPGEIFSEQFAVKNGRLGKVFVYVKSGPRAAMQGRFAPPEPVVLDQKGCQYTPHVIALMAGGSVQFRNSDPIMHNIHTMPTAVGNQTIDTSQGPRGQPIAKQFLKPELMMPVRCNMHPWMNAFVNVSATPFFAVSDAAGRFDLQGLPPGEYVLGAVHETLGEKTLQLTVPASGKAEANLTFPLK